MPEESRCPKCNLTLARCTCTAVAPVQERIRKKFKPMRRPKDLTPFIETAVPLREVPAPEDERIKTQRRAMGQCTKCGEMPDECMCEVSTPRVEPKPTESEILEAWAKYIGNDNTVGWERVAFICGYGRGFTAGLERARAEVSQPSAEQLRDIINVWFLREKMKLDVADAWQMGCFMEAALKSETFRSDSQQVRNIPASWNEWLAKFERAATSANPRQELAELLEEFSHAFLEQPWDNASDSLEQPDPREIKNGPCNVWGTNDGRTRWH